MEASAKTAVVRRASTEDIPQILALNESSDRMHMADYTDDYFEEELLFLINDPRCLFFVVSNGPKVLGYILGTMITPLWFYFIDIIVEETVRRMGVGKRLYGALRDECEKRGVMAIQGLVKDDENSTLKYWQDRGHTAYSRCVWVEDHIRWDE